MRHVLRSLHILLVLTALTSCKHKTPPPPKPVPITKATVPAEKILTDDEQLRFITDTTLRLLKKGSYAALSKLVHPVEGLTLSPYGYVNTEKTVLMTAEEVRLRFTSDTARRIFWGYYDGSGDPIELTPAAYARRFIYDRDFAKSDSLLFHKIPQRGNTLNNLSYAFPDGVPVESFVPGKSAMDWRALRMVFEKYNDQYYLVALVHDQWTI